MAGGREAAWRGTFVVLESRVLEPSLGEKSDGGKERSGRIRGSFQRLSGQKPLTGGVQGPGGARNQGRLLDLCWTVW